MASLTLDDLIGLGSGITRTALKRRSTGSAVDTLGAGIDAATATQGEGLQRQYGLYDPYRTAGIKGLDQLTTLSQTPTPGFDYKAPTNLDLGSIPGYQFGLDQGQLALQRQLAAAHGTVGGAALKQADRYGTDYATTKAREFINDDYTRQLQKYQLDQGNLDRQIGLAKDLTGVGQTATGELSSAEKDYARQITDLQTAKAAAIAAGDLVKAQQLDDAIAGISKTAGGILGGIGEAAGGITLDQLGSGLGKVGSAIGSGLGAAGKAVGTLGGLVPLAAGIPIVGGIAAAAAILPHLFGQGRKQADKLTGEGGLQSTFNQGLADIVAKEQSGEITHDQRNQFMKQLYAQLQQDGAKFASGGKNQSKVVQQMLQSYLTNPVTQEALRA